MLFNEYGSIIKEKMRLWVNPDLNNVKFSLNLLGKSPTTAVSCAASRRVPATKTFLASPSAESIDLFN